MKRLYKGLITFVCAFGTLCALIACAGNSSSADIIPPADVTGIMATRGDSSITLSWTKPGDSDYDGATIAYRRARDGESADIFPAENCGSADGVVTAEAEGSGAVMREIENLPPGTYLFRVCAKDNLNNRAAGVTHKEEIVTDATPPADVTELAAAGDIEITLTWTKPTDADYNGVTIAYQTGDTAPAENCASGTSVNVDGSDAAMHEILNLRGGNYRFRVCSKDMMGNRAAGVVVQRAVMSDPMHPNVETLVAQNGTGQVTLTWDKPDDDGYNGATVAYRSGNDLPSRRCTAATGVMLVEVDATAVMRVITGLTDGEYSFRVCAKYGADGLAVGATARGASDSMPPGDVAGVMADVAPGQVTLRWTKPSEPSDSDYNGVTIAYQTGNTFPAANCASGSGVTRVEADGEDAVTDTITSLAAETYSIRVCSKDTAGNRAAGETVTATVTASRVLPNVNTLAAQPGIGQVTLTWAKPSDSAYSGVTVAYQSGSTLPPESCAAATDVTIVQADGPDVVTHDVTGLTDGEYSFRVCAKYGADGVASGATASGTSDSMAPGEVTDVMTDVAAGQVTLDWTMPSDSDYDGVTIAYQSGSTAPADCTAGTVVQVDGATTIMRVITGLSAETYSFRVCSKDTAGNRATGVTETATVTASRVLPNVDTLAAQPGAGQVTLTWAKPSDSAYSGVTVAYQSGSTLPPASCVADTDVTLVQADGSDVVTHDITGLTDGTYSFRVCAKYGADGVAVGATAAGMSDSVPPGEVSGLAASVASAGGRITLRWTNPPDRDRDGVIIAYQTGATSPVNCAAATGVTLVQVDGAATEQHAIDFTRPLQYSFRVCAKDTANNPSPGTGTATAVTATVTEYGIGTATCNSAGSGAALDLIFGDGTYNDNCTQQTIANPDGYVFIGAVATLGTDYYGEVHASGGADGTSTFYRYVNNKHEANALATIFEIDSDGTVDVSGGRNVLVWLRSDRATTARVRLVSATNPVVRSNDYTITGITNYWQEFAIPIAAGSSGAGRINLDMLGADAVNKIEFILQNLSGTSNSWGVQHLDIDELRIGMPSDSIRFGLDSVDFDLGTNCIHAYGDDTTSCRASSKSTIASGETVGTVRANAISTTSESPTYSIAAVGAGNDDGNYAINATSGVITTAKAQSSLSGGTIATLTVTASLSSVSLSDTITVNVTNDGAVFTPTGPPSSILTGITITEVDTGCDSGSSKCLQISSTTGARDASLSFRNAQLRGLSMLTMRYKAQPAVNGINVSFTGAGGMPSFIFTDSTTSSTPSDTAAIVTNDTWQTLTVSLGATLTRTFSDGTSYTVMYSAAGDTITRVSFGPDDANAILTIDELYIH